MATKKKVKIMVASTVYQNRDLLMQICGILNGYGYHVINSEYGTLHPPLGMNNTDACKQAGIKAPVWEIGEQTVQLTFFSDVKLGGATKGANEGAIEGAIEGVTKEVKNKHSIKCYCS